MNIIHKILEELYLEFSEKENTGTLANYIPELTRVNPGNFGIVLTTVDGFQYAFGDTEVDFTIQSISKSFVYGMALEEHGVEKVLEKISVEPSGDAFNSISLYPETGRPFNPMINAGAIAATSMVWQVYKEKAFDKILNAFSDFAGTPLQMDYSVYNSESETGHRNRAIAHLLRNFNILESEVEAPLDVYFKQCSINVNCRQLSLMGATLAGNGKNPLTGIRALNPKYIPHVLSVMASCGMYDYSGEWIYHVGLPAKSGVGGGILAVLPGQLSIAVYSPLLDDKGNSVFGVEICERIAESFSLHLYKTPSQLKQVVRKQYTLTTAKSKLKRDAVAESMLEAFGEKVHIMQLQGELCFATSEIFIRKIPEDCEYLLLSLKKAISFDEGALKLLLMLDKQFQQRAKKLLVTNFSHLDLLQDFVQENHAFLQFAELEDAVLHLEKTILLANGYEPKKEPVALMDQQLLQGLSPSELSELTKYLKRETYKKGELIIQKGLEAQHIYFIESGQVALQDKDSNDRDITLALLTAGNSFGDMALLDNQKSSASVMAQTDVSCLVMVYALLDQVDYLAPIKVKILTNLAASLSARLWAAKMEIASFA
jgi:glutaminase